MSAAIFDGVPQATTEEILDGEDAIIDVEFELDLAATGEAVIAKVDGVGKGFEQLAYRPGDEDFRGDLIT